MYDFDVVISSRDADLETMKEKFGLLKEIAAMDRHGVMDGANFVREAVAMVDPSMADRLVGDPQAAAMQEVEDERSNVAKIVAGIEPGMKAQGQNYGLRLQTLMREVEQNPVLGQRIASQPDSRAIFENRVKHLQFMLQQQENANTGRVGTEPLKLREEVAG